MTREEAIKILDPETRRETMREIPRFERVAADTEACNIAVSALRAQQIPAKLDRSRWDGCVVCNRCGVGGSIKLLCNAVKAEYCPFCGRPLTDEAWAELERRIGGNDGTAD